MYFNSIDYGEGSYGIGTAAQTYFHTDVAHLTLAQSAMLAGLPLGPSRFDPAVFPADAVARRNYVLDRMEQLGYITSAEQKTAIAEPLVASAQQTQIQAPQFVFYVLDQLRQKYGDDLVEHGGITVTTSLDLDKQNAAQKIVSDHIATIASHNATNSGLISIDPHSGDIIAMVGSADYNNPTYGNVNITTSRLQPGSSWKPFEYLTAFEKGWTGGTVIDDKPISIPNYDGTAYAPKNFDEKYHGTMTIRKALDNSLNIPAVETLQFAGIDATLKTASDMGITGLGDASQYGLSLALGTAEVTPLDMATAYAALANQGGKVTPRAILKVTDRNGKNITQPDSTTPQTVMDPRYAYMMTSILSDDNARKDEFGLNSPLKLDRPDAAKTGTTEHFDDDWTVGYTPDLATAVWVGNNNHTPINGLNGIQGAAPIWHDFMEMASAGTPVHDFIQPPGVVMVEVCLSNGGLTSNTAGSVANEVYLVGHTPTTQCQNPPLAPTPVPSDNPAPDSPQPPIPPPNSNPSAQSNQPAPTPNPKPDHSNQSN
jgi:membrane peptidoglycan carboxypeptidase